MFINFRIWGLYSALPPSFSALTLCLAQKTYKTLSCLKMVAELSLPGSVWQNACQNLDVSAQNDSTREFNREKPYLFFFAFKCFCNRWIHLFAYSLVEPKKTKVAPAICTKAICCYKSKGIAFKINRTSFCWYWRYQACMIKPFIATS